MFHVECDRGQWYDCSPAETALLCIDFEADFLSHEGLCAQRGLPVDRLRRVLGPAARIQKAARERGLFVAHMRECYRPDLADLNAFRKARDTIIGAPGPLGRFLIAGEKGTEIVAELAPLAGEPVVDKAGFNGFFNTPLDSILRGRGITHLVLVGITSQCCVASTLRGAVDLGYFPLLLADACAAWDDRDHDATVSAIFSENHQFGWVSDSLRFGAALGANG
jgi:nicotinamidase-related amidase